jgi:hypothetical protein
MRLALEDTAPVALGPRPLLALAFFAGIGLSWLLTGVALFRRQRVGALLALVALLTSVGVGFFGRPFSARDVVFFLVSVGLLASTWHELH